MAGTSAAPSPRELAHAKLSRELAREGIVLLKNEGLLPLDGKKPVALLGSGAAATVKGGTGSGDVNCRESASIRRGLQEAGVPLTSEGWLADYEARYTAARLAWREKVLAEAKTVENPFDAYASNPFSLPEGRPLSKADVSGAGAAVYVVSRIAGEGKDRRLVEGDYYLSQREREDLLFLDRLGLPVILLINAGGPVELTGILEEAKCIRAVAFLSQLGQEGGHAVADVLLGRVSPCGKLTATWARHYADYPSADSFGDLNGELEREEYREGIFMGYRYFDRFAVEPLFPFGYGLSYTAFSLAFQSLRSTETGLSLTISVQNTGTRYPGREVAQVYVTPPGGMRRLAGFARTDLLQPGQIQRLTISIPQKQLASFLPARHAWVAEAGSYEVWLGNDARALRLAARLKVAEDVILERTREIHAEPPAFDRLIPPAAEAAAGEVPVFPFAPRPEKPPVLQTFEAPNWPVEELLPLLCGNVTEGTSNLGSAGTRVPGSAGETTETLEQFRGVRSLIMADGPAGLRLRQRYQADRKTGAVYGAGVFASLENGFLLEPEAHEDADTFYQFCTAFPVGTALAQTWDTALLERFGQAVAEEMAEFRVDLWLAPGMNLQRNPLCGRNFEYFSEDPLLSGLLAAAVTRGVQKTGGRGVTIKHFACNNQEDNRMGVDARVSERALRELYLRGFEIAVKACPPAAIMSSYNKLNGVHAANSRDLCTVIAREEWGFSGIILSDWNTTVPADGSIPWLCAAAGNDIIMPGNPADAGSIRKALETGLLSEEAVRLCAGRILARIQELTAHQ